MVPPTAGEGDALLWAALLGKGAAGAVAAAALAALALAQGGEAGMALLALAPLPGLVAAFAACTALLRAGGRTLAILLLNAGGIGLQLAGAAAVLAWRPVAAPLPLLLIWFMLVQAGQLAAALVLHRADRERDGRPPRAAGSGPRMNPGTPGACQRGGDGIGRLAWCLWQESWPLALAGLLAMAALRADVLIVNRALGEEATGWYGVGSRLLEALKWAPNAYLAVLFPLLAALAAPSGGKSAPPLTSREGAPRPGRVESGPPRSAASLAMHRSLRLLGLGSAALALVAAALAEPLVDLVYGPAFAPAVAPARALLLGLPATCLSAALLLRGFAAGQERRLLMVLAAALVLKLAGVSGGLASGGLVGAALGSALAEWGALLLAACWWRWWSTALARRGGDERGAALAAGPAVRGVSLAPGGPEPGRRWAGTGPGGGAA